MGVDETFFLIEHEVIAVVGHVPATTPRADAFAMAATNLLLLSREQGEHNPYYIIPIYYVRIFPITSPVRRDFL